MKKRKRFSLAWLALLALAGGVELLIVDGTLSGGAPLSRVASSVRETLDQTPTPANAASQQMYIWKDASGVTHISETPPPKPPAGKVEEYQFSPQPPAAQPEPVAPLDIPSPEHQPSAAELEKAAAEARKRLQQQVEQLQKERGQLEKQDGRRPRGAGKAHPQTVTYAMQPPVRNGFTLIEIVSVLVVLGVLAYLGISAFRGNDEITAYAERDRLLSQLVYARAQGMAMGGGQCVTIDTNKVSFFMKGKSALPTLLKDYTPSASIQSTPPATFCFDAAGSVCGEDSLGNPNDTGILYCTASASDQTFSFGGGITLTLFAETGFVQ